MAKTRTATAIRQSYGSTGGGLTLDTAAFDRSLAEALSRMTFAAVEELDRCALDVQNDARALCRVDTGRLRSSIQIVRAKLGTVQVRDVGTNVFYAIFNEYGTRWMSAQPFIRPALARMAGLFAGRIGRAARDAL